MKTILAPDQSPAAGPQRLGLSTNILGNRDGEVLEDPQSFKTKEGVKALGPGAYLAA